MQASRNLIQTQDASWSASKAMLWQRPISMPRQAFVLIKERLCDHGDSVLHCAVGSVYDGNLQFSCVACDWTVSALCAQGTASAETQAVSQAGPSARGTTAYLNLETGDSHGDMSSVVALVNSGVSRVVIGLLHPLPHLRGQAVRTLKAAGISVDVLQPGPAAQGQAAQQCLQACLQVNEVGCLTAP